MKELLGAGKDQENVVQSSTGSKKRQSSAISINSGDDGSDDDENDSQDNEIQRDESRKRYSSVLSSDGDAEPMVGSKNSLSTTRQYVLGSSSKNTAKAHESSPHARPSQTKKQKVMSEDELDSSGHSTMGQSVKGNPMALDEEDEDDDIPVARLARPRVRSGFIVDSSDEE